MTEWWPPEPVTERKSPPPVSGLPVDLPDLSGEAPGGPSSRAIVQPPTRAPAHTRTRGRRPTRRDAQSLLPDRLAWLGWAVLAEPPSLAAEWNLHAASARYFEGYPALKVARYAQGCIHTGVSALLLALSWWTRSAARGLALGAVIALLVFWPF